MRRVAAAVLTLAVVAAVPSVPEAEARPNRPTQTDSGVDPKLLKDLETVVAVSPAASCLTVKLDGKVVFQHGGSSPQTPASTQKIFTANAALELLGADHRFTTSVVSASRAAGGVLRGDLSLVGGGDPVLTSSLYRAVRKVPADRTITLLDDLAAKVRAAGITRVTGRVIGDESRYDSLRVVPTWPERYATQNQSGPLSALSVDDGYRLEATESGVIRRRAEDPPVTAAQIFTDLLGAKGVEVDGDPGAGRAAPDASVVASVESAPLRDIVVDMLLRSDNQTAELLVKELGRAKAGAGTTAAGAGVLTGWRADNGLALPGTASVDGSGLDRGNRVTCDELVTVLDHGKGRESVVAAGLPVAGVSGTLAARFRNSPAVGRLRGKTGSLNSVTALAGFVDLVEGGHATFAYIANGEAVSAKVLAAQDLLATVLATYLPPCEPGEVRDVVAPVPIPAGVLATLAAGPVGGPALAGLLAATDAMESDAKQLGDRCLREDDDVLVRLVT